eukprot:sb/3475085/
MSSDNIPVYNFQRLGRQVMGLKFPGFDIPFLGSLTRRKVLPSVIHVGTWLVLRLSFRSSAIRSWRQVVCFIQKAWRPSMPGVDQLVSLSLSLSLSHSSLSLRESCIVVLCTRAVKKFKRTHGLILKSSTT